MPHSEPIAVVTGPDRAEYLSVRVDRKEVAGRPREASHLEFATTSCVACVGEDVPERLLARLGVYMVTGGPHVRRRPVVTPYLRPSNPTCISSATS